MKAAPRFYKTGTAQGPSFTYAKRGLFACDEVMVILVDSGDSILNYSIISGENEYFSKGFKNFKYKI